MENDDDIFDGLEDDKIVDQVIDTGAEPVVTDDDFFSDKLVDQTPNDSVLDEFLKARGINNSTINLLDEDGTEKEVNFYDLTREEQLEILNSVSEPSNENLDDSEIELINHLRTNNMSIDDFLTQFKESILAEIQQPAEVSYDIDAYNDQELFLLDLKNKYDLTEDELSAELEKELKNEELFTKKVTKLRSEYKQLEDQSKAAKQAEFEAQRAEQYNQFANNMVDIATKTPDFHGVVLEDEEKQETLSYLLELDDNGVSRFSLDLNDPVKLYEAAWYMRYGKEAFQALESAYEAEIAKLKKELKPDKPRVVVQNSKKNVSSINDLDY